MRAIYLWRCVVFLLNVRRTKFLFQCGFGRSVQHFLPNFGRVGRIAYQKPVVTGRCLLVQPEKYIAWRVLFDQWFNKLRVVFFPIIINIVTGAQLQFLCVHAKNNNNENERNNKKWTQNKIGIMFDVAHPIQLRSMTTTEIFVRHWLPIYLFQLTLLWVVSFHLSMCRMLSAALRLLQRFREKENEASDEWISMNWKTVNKNFNERAKETTDTITSQIYEMTPVLPLNSCTCCTRVWFAGIRIFSCLWPLLRRYNF